MHIIGLLTALEFKGWMNIFNGKRDCQKQTNKPQTKIIAKYLSYNDLFPAYNDEQEE